MPSPLLQNTAFLGGLLLFLAGVDFLLPKPLPFIRTGLTNVPILIAARILPVRYVYILLVIKIFSLGIINGVLFSPMVLLTIGGGLASVSIMLLLTRIPERFVGMAGISSAAGMTHGVVQLVIARFIFLGKGAWYAMPVVIASGLVSGFIMGLVAGRLLNTGGLKKLLVGNQYE